MSSAPIVGMLTAFVTRPPFERRHDLLGDDHAGAVLRLVGRGGEVRRDDDVVELEQRAGYGSDEKTSSAAPATLPESSASTSAASSTSSPRAALTMPDAVAHRAIASRRSSPRVSSVSGRCSVTKSAAA